MLYTCTQQLFSSPIVCRSNSSSYSLVVVVSVLFGLQRETIFLLSSLADRTSQVFNVINSISLLLKSKPETKTRKYLPIRTCFFLVKLSRWFSSLIFLGQRSKPRSRYKAIWLSTNEELRVTADEISIFLDIFFVYSSSIVFAFLHSVFASQEKSCSHPSSWIRSEETCSRWTEIGSTYLKEEEKGTHLSSLLFLAILSIRWWSNRQSQVSHRMFPSWPQPVSPMLIS